MSALEFTAVYERHVDDVFGYLALRAGSRHAAEDLTQETFERALRGWRTFDPALGLAKGWLLAIARNVYVDSRRRSSARPAVEIHDGIGEEQGEVDPPAVPGVDAAMAAALRKVGRREREALALRFGGDLRMAQVADALGVSHANAQQIVSRALRRLRSILDRREAE